MHSKNHRLLPGILILCAGLLLRAVPVLGQESHTKTEANDYYGAGGKKVTTETTYPNGDVTIEAKYYDPSGKLKEEERKSPGSDGGTTTEREIYDCNGQLKSRDHIEKDSSGKILKTQVETYQDGMLSDGTIHEYDEKGKLKSNKKYDPATQRYENRPLPKAPQPSFPEGYFFGARTHSEPCPPPQNASITPQVALANSLVGIVVPANAQPGDQVSGSVVLDPDRYKDIPGLAVYEAHVPLQQVGGQASLVGLVVEVSEKKQPADDRILFEIPEAVSSLVFNFLRSEDPSIHIPGEIPIKETPVPPVTPQTPVTPGTPGAPGSACCNHLGGLVMCPSGLPAGSSSVKFVTGGTEWVTPEGKNVLVKQSTFLPCEKTKESSKDTFQTPPVVSPGGIAPIQGPFDGDSSDSSVKIAGKDAKIVAQSRDVSFADIPVETPAGRNEMVVTDGDKGATIPVCVLNVSVSADDLTLRSGQKTKAHVGLNGPEQCPDSVWAHAGVPGDLVDVGKLMPDFRVPGKEDEGKILLKIVSSGSIKMKDAKNNTILKWLSQADFEKGPYKTDLDLQGTAVGGFGIVVTAYPFLAPIEGEPFDVPPEKQAESGGEQTPAQTDKFISQLRDLAERARDAAEATEDQARKEELEDLARDFEEIADALEETPDTSEQVSGGPDNWRKLAKVYRKQAEQARQNALVAKDPASKKFWEEKAAGDEKEAKLNEDRATSAEQEAKQDDQMETRGGKDTDLNANGFPKAPTEGTVKTPPKPATPKPNCDEVCGDEKREADRANKAELAIYESLKPAEKQMEEARKKLKQAEKFWLALEDNYSVVPFVGPSTADIENAAHAYAAAQGVFDAAAKNYKYWAGKMGTAIQECIRAREKYHECLRSKGCPVPTGTSC